MKFSKLDNWDPGFRHDGILYFAQRIQEMLFHYTSHIYKAPVLNTQLLVREYINTAKLVRQHSINESHLKYILDEFQEAFLNDIIIQENVDDTLQKELLHKLNSSSLQEQERNMRYILYLLKDYNIWCKEYLKRIVLQEKEKKKIERALRSYIPGLIGGGYSHEYIYYYVKKVFFEQPVDSTEVLTVFLDRFDFKPKKYEVYVAIEKRTHIFKEILEKRLRIEFGQEEYALDLKYDAQKYSVVKTCLSALDEPGAASKAYDRLNIFFKYYQFLGDHRDDWLFGTGKIVDESGTTSFLDLKPEGFDFSTQIEEQVIGTFSEHLIILLLENAKNALRVIDRTMDIHNLAIADKNIKNGFLNLWSILEILFVSSREDSKITEIESKVLPILQKDYIQIVFQELSHYFSDNVLPEKCNELRKKVNLTEDDNLWFYYLMVLPEYKELREETYALLSDYPLIRSRLYQVSDTYVNKKAFSADITRYTRRISWHFKRLYRTRNAIIHAGEEPSNLKELGEHLHSYVDECLLEIAVLLAEKAQLGTIDNAVIDVQFRMELIQKRLGDKGQITKDDLRFILSGDI